MKDILKVAKEYYEKFGEPFPLALLQGTSSSKLVNIMRECIDTNTLYNPKLDKEGYY